MTNKSDNTAPETRVEAGGKIINDASMTLLKTWLSARTERFLPTAYPDYKDREDYKDMEGLIFLKETSDEKLLQDAISANDIIPEDDISRQHSQITKRDTILKIQFIKAVYAQLQEPDALTKDIQTICNDCKTQLQSLYKNKAARRDGNSEIIARLKGIANEIQNSLEGCYIQTAGQTGERSL